MRKLFNQNIVYILIALILIALFYYPILELGFYYADDRGAYTPWLNSELWSFSSYSQMLVKVFDLEFLDMHGTQNTFRILGQLAQMAANNVSTYLEVPIRVVGYWFNLLATIPLIIFFRLIIKDNFLFLFGTFFFFTTTPILNHFYWLINIAYAPILFLTGIILIIFSNLERKKKGQFLNISIIFTLQLLFLLTSELALSLPLILIFTSVYLYGNNFKKAIIRYSSLLILNSLYVLFYLILLSNSDTSSEGVFNQTLAQVYGDTGQIITYFLRFLLTFLHIIFPINAVNSIYLLVAFMIGYGLYLYTLYKSGIDSIKFVLLSLFVSSLPLAPIGVSRLYYLYMLILPISIAIIVKNPNIKLKLLRSIFTALLIFNIFNSIHWYSVYKNDIDMEKTTLYHDIVTKIKSDYFGISIENPLIEYKLMPLTSDHATVDIPLDRNTIEKILKNSKYRLMLYSEFLTEYKENSNLLLKLEKDFFPFKGWVVLKGNEKEIYVMIGGISNSHPNNFDILKKHEFSKISLAKPIFILKKPQK